MAVKNAFKLGTVVALVATLFSLILGKFFSGLFNLKELYATSINLQTGISPTIYNSIAAIFTSIGFNFTSFLMLWISAIVLVFVGGYLVDAFKIKSKKVWQEYFWTILLGTGVGYLIFVGFVLKIGIAGVIGAVIYAAIIAMLTAWVYPIVDKAIK